MDTSKVPDSCGECVDMLEVVKEKKSGLDKQKKELDTYATMIKESLKKDMEKQGLTECAGTNMRVKFLTKTKYSLANKGLFCDYIIKTEYFELMTAAVNQSAIQERIDEGEDVPGLTKYDLVTASLTKRT